MRDEKQENYSVCVDDDALQFIAPEIGTVKRKIVTAANRHRKTGALIVGARHWSPAMTKQADMMGLDGGGFDQGFIDQYDQYLSRSDAKRIAIKNEQPLIGDDWGELFSENLH